MRLLLLIVLVLVHGASSTPAEIAQANLSPTPTNTNTNTGTQTPGLATWTPDPTKTATSSPTPSGSAESTPTPDPTSSPSRTATLTTIPTSTPPPTPTPVSQRYFSTSTQRASAAQNVEFRGSGVGDAGEKLAIIPTSVNCGDLNTASNLQRIPIGGGEKDLNPTTNLAQFDFTGVTPDNYRACFKDNNPAEYVNDRNVVIPILPATVPTLRGPTGGGLTTVPQGVPREVSIDGGNFSPLDTVRFVLASSTGCATPLVNGADIAQNDLNPVVDGARAVVRPVFNTPNTRFGVCYRREADPTTTPVVVTRSNHQVFQRLAEEVVATPAVGAGGGVTAGNEVSTTITGCTGQFADTDGVNYNSGITNPPSGAVVRAYPASTTCGCGDVGAANGPAAPIQTDGSYTMKYTTGGIYTLCYADNNTGTTQQQQMGVVSVFSSSCSNALGATNPTPAPSPSLPTPVPVPTVAPVTTGCAASSDDDDSEWSLIIPLVILGLCCLSYLLAAIAFFMKWKKKPKDHPPPPAPAPILQDKIVYRDNQEDKDTIARLQQEILVLKSRKPQTEVKYVNREVVKEVMVPGSPRVVQEAADVEIDDRLLQEKKELIHQLKTRVEELENEPRGVAVAPDPMLVQRLHEAEREIVYLEGQLANTRGPVAVAAPVETVRVMEEPILMEEPIFMEQQPYYGGYPEEYIDPLDQISAPPTTPAGLEYGDYIIG